MFVTILFVAALAIGLVWAIAGYNKLIALKGQTANAWK